MALSAPDYSPYIIRFKVSRGRGLYDVRNKLPIWNFRADTPGVYKSEQLRSDFHSWIILSQTVPECIKADCATLESGVRSLCVTESLQQKCEIQGTVELRTLIDLMEFQDPL